MAVVNYILFLRSTVLLIVENSLAVWKRSTYTGCINPRLSYDVKHLKFRTRSLKRDSHEKQSKMFYFP